MKKNIRADEIELIELLRLIFKNKYYLIIFVILFTIGGIAFAYYQQNVFNATTTLEISKDEGKGSSQNALITDAIGISSSAISLQTEIEVIKSRFLIEKAIKNIDFSTKYFVFNNLKKIELYKNTPFTVDIENNNDLSFKITILDDEKFKLESESLNYKAICKWGEKIENKDFKFTAYKKKDAILNNDEYLVVKSSTRTIINTILSNLNVSLFNIGVNIISINYEDNIALRAKEFTNELAKTYLEQNIDRKTIEASKTLEFIDNQLLDISRNLRNSEMNIENFKKTAEVIDISAEAKSTIEKLSKYDSDLADITIEENSLNLVYDAILNKNDLSGLNTSILKFSDSTLIKLINIYQDELIKKSILLFEFTNEHPDVIKSNKQLNNLKEMILSSIKNTRISIKNKKESINEIIAEYNKVIKSLPTSERILADLNRKFIVNEKVYLFLLEKRAESEISKASTVNKNRILDEALIPLSPIKPKKKNIILISLIMGLILGLVFIILKEFFDDRIKSNDHIENNTRIPLLGIVPHIKEVTGIKVFDSPKSSITEAFRSLRTNLGFMSTSNTSQVITVSSTVGGEGKTTIAANLGAIFSLIGKKTIVINLDMRKPTLHKKFDLSNKLGISSVLAKKINLEEVIQKTEYENLDIVAAGPIPPNPSELIQSDEMKIIIKKLKENYDLIIFDTPPIGIVTDAMTVMQNSDVSIYLIRTMYSKKNYLNSLNKLFEDGNIKGLCLVINDIKEKNDGYGYGYYSEEK